MSVPPHVSTDLSDSKEVEVEEDIVTEYNTPDYENKRRINVSVFKQTNLKRLQMKTWKKKLQIWLKMHN